MQRFTLQQRFRKARHSGLQIAAYYQFSMTSPLPRLLPIQYDQPPLSPHSSSIQESTYHASYPLRRTTTGSSGTFNLGSL